MHLLLLYCTLERTHTVLVKCPRCYIWEKWTHYATYVFSTTASHLMNCSLEESITYQVYYRNEHQKWNYGKEGQANLQSSYE
jgi:hypothetical protein